MLAKLIQNTHVLGSSHMLSLQLVLQFHQVVTPEFICFACTKLVLTTSLIYRLFRAYQMPEAQGSE